MILYLDTSALVKLYAEETGSEMVRQAVADCALVATSLVSYVETRSAFARKARTGEMAARVLNQWRRDFERDWTRLHRMPVNAVLVRRAGDLAQEHALRALDALHLATAHSLQSALGATVTLACFDAALNTAATAGGLESLRRKRG